MVMTNLPSMSENTARPAFDIFHGFALCAVLASLESAGALELVDRHGSWESAAAKGEELLSAELLRYLVDREILRPCNGGHELTPLAAAIRSDIGYLVWLSSGYGLTLSAVGDFLVGARRYGSGIDRDGRGVAVGSAIVGARDLVPSAQELMRGVSFRRVLDLGCGNARFLLSVCRASGATGLGLDVSAQACAEAEREIARQGDDVRVSVRCADAGDLGGIPELESTDLVITFFLLHEILADGHPALVRYLRRMADRLPAGAHLLAAEVSPPDPALAPGSQLFSPEFTLVHAIMRQRLMDECGWHETFAAGGFEMVRAVRPRMPGGLLMLVRKAG